ncbi:MAG TPA: UxaA family hydrolase, partial [Asticcacaulis sp.]|nr:UxaA family hydrolase [Asticcacaulis sp.]
MSTGPFLLLHPDDNVLVCRQHAFRGQSITLDDETVTLSDEIQVGHKIARRDLKAGDKIIKYGAPIGSMKADVTRGA